MSAPTILHIEDDDDWAQLVRRWLAAEGYAVRRVRSGAELELAAAPGQAAPACVIMDLGLPDADGLSLCDGLKRSPSLQRAPIVVLTASAATPTDCLRHQALARVLKDGAARDALLAALAAVLTQHERSRGVLEAGDLTLDPEDRSVRVGGGRPRLLSPGRFSALRLLVRSAPEPVADAALYEAFLERHPYRTAEPGLVRRQTLRDDMYHLRRDLGPSLAARLVRVEGRGYAYRHPSISNRWTNPGSPAI